MRDEQSASAADRRHALIEVCVACAYAEFNLGRETCGMRMDMKFLLKHFLACER